MVDTLDIAKKLRADGVFTPEQAESIASAVAQASNVEHLGELRKQLSEIETRLRLHDWILGIVILIGLGLLWQTFALHGRVAAIEERLTSFQQQTDRRFTDVNQRLDVIEQRTNAIESKLDQLLARP